MKIKKGDNVIVIAGKDRGKTGEVTAVHADTSTVVVSGVNVVKRHKKNRTAKGKGQVVEKAMPVHVSNVQIVEDGVPTRVRIERTDGKRVRVAVKSGKNIA